LGPRRRSGKFALDGRDEPLSAGDVRNGSSQAYARASLKLFSAKRFVAGCLLGVGSGQESPLLTHPVAPKLHFNFREGTSRDDREQLTAKL
jgi:hypothetical protein